jgi:tetratricopeptide (TPR) repeat protein
MKKRILFLVLSLFFFCDSAQGRAVSRAEFVEDANILYLKGDYNSLIETVSYDLKRQRLSRGEKKEVLYLTGLSYLELGDFDAARAIFSKVLKMRGEEYRQDAQIGIADSYFRQKNIDQAINAYEEILVMYPRSNRLSSVYYNLGLCYKEKNDSSKARSYFEEIRERFDSSFEADKIAVAPTIRPDPDFYIIQLGAFKRLKNAKQLVRRLSRKKYDSYIQKIRKNGRVLYRVRGGKFSNQHYAKRLLKRLKRDGFPAKIILE